MSAAADHLVERAARAKQEGRPADAKRDLLEAIALMADDAGGIDMARALRLLGEVERKLRNDPAARQHYEQAVAICRNLDNAPLLAHTIRHLGDVHHDAGRAELAEPCYREALRIYRSDPDTPPLELANAIRSLAVLLGEAGEKVEARALWLEARELYAQAKVEAGVAESSARLVRLSA